MALWFSLMSMINAGSVISAPAGPEEQLGAQLTLGPTPLTGATPEELWAWQPDPNNSGYFLIINYFSGLVVDVGDASGGSAPPIQTSTKNSSNAQLWQFVADPGGSGYYSIQSKLSTPDNPLVINVADGSIVPGNLILWPAPTAGPTPNELWAPVVTLPPTLTPGMACRSWIQQLWRYITTGGLITPTQHDLWEQAIKQCGNSHQLTRDQMNEALGLLSEIPVLSNGSSGPIPL